MEAPQAVVVAAAILLCYILQGFYYGYTVGIVEKNDFLILWVAVGS